MCMCAFIDHVCTAEYRQVSKKCLKGAAEAAGKGAGREWSEAAEAASSSGEATTTKAELTSSRARV